MIVGLISLTSCLKINLAKSKKVPIANVNNVEGLADILGCRVFSLPMKYLGLPLGVSFLNQIYLRWHY
jgi:hypothetical protein